MTTEAATRGSVASPEDITDLRGRPGARTLRSWSSRKGATSRRVPLGERLVAAGLITGNELQSGLSEQSSRGLRLGETLVALGFVEEYELLPFLAEQMGVQCVALRDGLVDPKVVRLIPQSLAEPLTCLALCRVRQRLAVAMADPTDLTQIDQIAHATGLHVRPVLAMRETIE